MLLFGGQNVGVANLNDVWSWIVSEDTSVDWRPVSPSGNPPTARYGHSGVYDSTNSRMIIFGGGTGTTGPAPCQNDVSVLINANGLNGTPTWTALTTAGNPPAPRFAHTAAYDAVTNAMMVFGGSDCASGYFNDMWVLTHANGLGGAPTWHQLAPTGSGPLGREGSTSVYDPATNVLVIYGGDSGTASRFSDVWMLSHANGTGGTPAWAQVFPTGTVPAARSGQSATYDSSSNRMTVFGGVTAGGTVAGDTWLLIGANGQSGTPSWSKVNPTAPGAPKAYHSAVYNPATNEMIVFGGEIVAVPADDHLFVLSQANGLR